MTHSAESLKHFGWNIQKLIQKQDLSREESYGMFREVLLNLQPELQQGAFLAALVAKGETPQEIAGAWQAICEIDTVSVSNGLKAPLVENSGTGMDQLKTFNVSTAASIIAAAGGARLARHGARALTSSCGTVDLLEMLGIDVECDVEKVAESIREAGIGLFNGMSPKVHPQSLGRILSQIRFGSTLNIAASLASPVRPTHALRGVYSEGLVSKVSEVMKEIGFKRAMVVHGFDSSKEKGMDEFSTLGESFVQEIFPDGSETTFSLAPEDVGIKRADYSAVAATGDLRKEALRFMKVISGTAHFECIDFACLNAGAILYLIGKANDIKAGVELSREIVGSGQALRKLSEWVSAQGVPLGVGVQRYLELSKEAGVEAQVRTTL
jgi:anthranilate phosphoribosyltransferase